MILYNTGIWLFGLIMRLAGRFHRKADRRMQGLKDIFRRMAAQIDSPAPLIWIHAASLGEFEQGRSVIEDIRKNHRGYKILLTFFSPAGYEARKDYPGVDHVFYLPIDTPRNARRFVRIARPEIAIFIKYEFWLNYLRQLSKAGCRIFLISAIFREEQIFFKWWAGTFRRGLRLFEWLFVQNESSRMLLDGIGIENVTVTGDTRFDRVEAAAKSARKIPAVERFVAGERILVAGSTWPADEFAILETMRRNPGSKYIIVPHEIVEDHIESLVARSPLPAVRYTECDFGKDPAEFRVMIVDVIGILTSVYRYATYAYVGGGFGKGIHNLLEAAAFGAPVAFGPNYHLVREACDLIATGAAASIDSADELDEWIAGMENDPGRYDDLHELARDYVARNTGATRKIVEHIFGK